MNKIGSWYALAVNTNQEKRIRERILDRLEKRKYSTKNMIIIAPEQELTVERKDGSKEQIQKLTLPGYLLIYGRAINEEVLFNMSHVKGVLGFLGGNENPTPLTDKEVNNMIGEDNSKNQEAISASVYTIGDDVNIIEGPFSGFGGKIVELDEQSGAVKIEIEIFGRATLASLSTRQLKPL